jgi:uncharacterized membrane protein YdjX (TVP38/TMEM64 family)
MKKVYLGIGIFCLIIIAIKYSGDYLSLQTIKDYQEFLKNSFEASPFLFMAVFFIIYVLTSALSLPFATLLTLSAGAIFGFTRGFILISFASTIGATFAFLMARYFFKSYFEKKFPEKSQKIQENFEQNGSSYLLSMRLVPIFPFYIVNILFGLTRIEVKKFFLYSQIGMIPGTLIYVNAGKNLGSIEKIQDILSLKVMLSFTLLAAFPFIMKKLKFKFLQN